MENPTPDSELIILKIIGKHPGIHHRVLVDIIVDKGHMAKATAAKNIKILIDDEKIFSHKYGKEIQYVLPDGQLSEKDLKKKFLMILKKFKNELENIEKEFDNYDYYEKLDLPDYLIDAFERLSEERSFLIKSAKANKITDMSFEKEVFRDIRKLAPYHSTDDEILIKKHVQPSKIMDKLGEMTRDYAELLEKKSKMGASKSRNAITSKIEQMDSDIANLRDDLIAIRDELQSKNKTKL